MKPERIAPLPPSARSMGLEAGRKLRPEARAFYRRWVGWTVAGRGSRLHGCRYRWGAGGDPEHADCAGIRSACRLWVDRGDTARRRSGDRHDAATASAAHAPQLAGGDQRGGRNSVVDRTPPEFDSSHSLVLTRTVAGRRDSRARPCCYPSAAQYLLLRSAILTARRWIWVNVLAWSLGICWTFAPSPLVNASTPLLSLIGIYAVAGLLMATTVAVITGLCWLSRLRSGTVRTVSGVA